MLNYYILFGKMSQSFKLHYVDVFAMNYVVSVSSNLTVLIKEQVIIKYEQHERRIS